MLVRVRFERETETSVSLEFSGYSSSGYNRAEAEVKMSVNDFRCLCRNLSSVLAISSSVTDVTIDLSSGEGADDD